MSTRVGQVWANDEGPTFLIIEDPGVYWDDTYDMEYLSHRGLVLEGDVFYVPGETFTFLEFELEDWEFQSWMKRLA